MTTRNEGQVKKTKGHSLPEEWNEGDRTELETKINRT
jgi:hypothetical protein